MINKDIENTEALLNALHEENMARRAGLRDRKRIVVKVGSSSLLHSTTKRLDYHKIDVLVRELSDLKNRGKDVILVSSKDMTWQGLDVINSIKSLLLKTA